MSDIFGPVAAMYDDVRPGYPAAAAAAIVDFHGGVPGTTAEVGAGTGKGTELLVRLGGRITCLEPDPGMAAVLRSRFPAVEVRETTFEEWDAPPGGVDLIACALAWHWLDPATRSQRARAALAPAGTLAVIANVYGYADPAVSEAIDGVLRSEGYTAGPRPEHWVRDEIRESGAFGRVEERVWHTYPEFSRDRYLQLVQTFSPFRRRTPVEQQTALAGLREALGDTLTLDLTTTLVLARD